ncbi:MAG: hypothetical protein A2Y40_07240 [Candidatus Margulisbacteria bacterium GWF2_35_9]|nr:MAG: hypothetical protein A2Y40_07240 [Candidatus Margulisbacteria bacterium GWF2_35_9]
MTRIKEFSLISKDGLTLFGKIWHTDLYENGIICLIHGIGEHSGRYDHLAKAFNNIGYSVAAIDLRGHGKSDGKRGHIQSYTAILNDITILFNYACKQSSKKKYIYGHSLGGNLVLNYILEFPTHFYAAIVTSPLLRLAFIPPKWKLYMATLVKRVIPSLSMPTNLKIYDLSHDPHVLELYRKDPLVHSQISANTFVSFISSGITAINKAPTLKIPLLLMHGSLDAITSPQASLEFSYAAGSLCSFKEWAGLYHELHNELEKEDVIKYMCDWLLSL